MGVGSDLHPANMNAGDGRARAQNRLGVRDRNPRRGLIKIHRISDPPTERRGRGRRKMRRAVLGAYNSQLVFFNHGI